ncbi:MAG: hypothetical protein OXQ31_21885 [Spirochaetaceae bacterium]|nr:hypothetical protein [Spirochaetaceae bacterium]
MVMNGGACLGQLAGLFRVGHDGLDLSGKRILDVGHFVHQQLRRLAGKPVRRDPADLHDGHYANSHNGR